MYRCLTDSKDTKHLAPGRAAVRAIAVGLYGTAVCGFRKAIRGPTLDGFERRNVTATKRAPIRQREQSADMILRAYFRF